MISWPRTEGVVAFAVTGCLGVLLASGVSGGSDTAGPRATLPDPPSSDFSLIGTAEIPDPTDLWLHGDVVYVGSRTGASPSPVQVFDISDPETPRLTATIELDAEKTNDVKISEDGSLAVVTHEGSSDGLNGITLLDPNDPRHPTTIGRVTDALSYGVQVHEGLVYVTAGRGGSGQLQIYEPLF